MTETSTFLKNMDAEPGARWAHQKNRFGLAGMDHVALPSIDIDLMARFMEEVLGGEPYYIAGFNDVDRDLGRPKHIFMRIGDTLMQVAPPQDGQLKIGKDDHNAWPHWAFGVTADGMRQNVERLKSLGIPLWGPVEHRGVEAVSVYFESPEGHKLELVTYDEFPAEDTIGVAGAPGVPRMNFAEMHHDWPNVKR